jgi:hypothetical protein
LTGWGAGVGCCAIVTPRCLLGQFTSACVFAYAVAQMWQLCGDWIQDRA